MSIHKRFYDKATKNTFIVINEIPVIGDLCLSARKDRVVRFVDYEMYISIEGNYKRCDTYGIIDLSPFGKPDLVKGENITLCKKVILSQHKP